MSKIDAQGNRTAVKLPDGCKLKRHYYGSGHLLSIALDAVPEVISQPRDRTRPQVTVSFRYDPLGRRISKTSRRTLAGQQYGKEVTTRFVWDEFRLLQEIRDEVPLTYVYSDQNSHEPLARIDGVNAPDIYWFHNQPSGTPERLTDAEGRVCWEAQNSAWGKLLSEREMQLSGSAQNLRMQGQYLDRETGLHYNLFRYYDPDCGRFTQQDPIGLAGGLNFYQYAPNALNWIDPLGLKCSGSAVKLNRKLSALEKAQKNAANIRILPDARIRYYNEEALARTFGPTRGRSHVTEWNTKNGDVRVWEETYNHSGQVNRVHPKMKNGDLLDLPHYPPTKADIDSGIATFSGRAVPLNLRGLL